MIEANRNRKELLERFWQSDVSPRQFFTGDDFSIVPHAKLTRHDVIRIRERRGGGERCVTIAKDYGVDPSVISRASRGDRYRWVR